MVKPDEMDLYFNGFVEDVDAFFLGFCEDNGGDIVVLKPEPKILFKTKRNYPQDMDREIVAKALLKNKPQLTASSVKTYVSIISSLYKAVGASGDALEFFRSRSKQVLEHLKDTPYNRRKTILAGLVSLCGDHACADVYRSLMLKDADIYDKEQKEGVLTETQKKNWITQDELKAIYQQKSMEAKHLFQKKTLSKHNLEDLQDFVILSLYTLIEPRRIMDYTEFKVRNINPETDNYMKGNSFVFNAYKTRKSYGQQVVKIPALLNSIIRRWASMTTSDYLLFSPYSKNKLQQAQLTLRLNRILGRNASVNILRHSFLTEKYKNMPALKELEETAQAMGHSLQEAMQYRKQVPS